MLAMKVLICKQMLPIFWYTYRNLRCSSL